MRNVLSVDDKPTAQHHIPNSIKRTHQAIRSPLPLPTDGRLWLEGNNDSTVFARVSPAALEDLSSLSNQVTGTSYWVHRINLMASGLSSVNSRTSPTKCWPLSVRRYLIDRRWHTSIFYRPPKSRRGRSFKISWQQTQNSKQHTQVDYRGLRTDQRSEHARAT